MNMHGITPRIQASWFNGWHRIGAGSSTRLSIELGRQSLRAGILQTS
jgi:hypothetical protein